MAKKSDIIEELQLTISELEKLLTERIADIHDVKMGKQCLHAYMYYREKLWEIKRLTNKVINGN